MAEVTLQQYKVQERQMAARDAKRGFRIHAFVTVVVLLGLVALNVFVASEFPWAIFPAVGMSIGLWFHWFFGVRQGDEFMLRHQQEIESEATRRAG
jgi:hypothetical protein